jgi:hypothetical protein
MLLCHPCLLATAQQTASQQQMCTATQTASVMRLVRLTHLVPGLSLRTRHLLHRHLQMAMVSATCHLRQRLQQHLRQQLCLHLRILQTGTARWPHLPAQLHLLARLRQHQQQQQ